MNSSKNYLNIEKKLEGLQLDQEVTRSIHVDSPVFRSAAPHSGFSEHDNHFGLDSLPMPSLRKSLEPCLNDSSIHTSLLDTSLKSQSLDYEFLEHVSEVAPPTVPLYIEPAFHFYSSKKASPLLSSVLEALKALNVDFDLQSKKFKISCKAYREGSSIPFIVRIFSNPKDSRFIVEFQRRSGDILYFSEIYRFVKDSVTLDSSVQPPLSSKYPAPPPAETLELENALEATKVLLQMASSEFADVKAQAVAFISSLSDPVMKKACLEVGMLEVLLASLACRFEDVHRPAIAALANLCEKNVDACKRVIAHQNVRYLHSLSASETKQVVRNCARMLKELSSCGVEDLEIKKTMIGINNLLNLDQF